MTTNLRNPTTIPMYITPYLMQDITTTPTPKLPSLNNATPLLKMIYLLSFETKVIIYESRGELSLIV